MKGGENRKSLNQEAKQNQRLEQSSALHVQNQPGVKAFRRHPEKGLVNKSNRTGDKIQLGPAC